MTAFHRNGRVLTALVLVLVACDGKDERNLAALDAELVNNTADSAIREAIEAPLATDPQLAGDSQRNAVRPAPRPLNGAVPANLSPADARKEAVRLAGGKLMRTPAATQEVTSTKDPVTLGGMTQQQGGKCGSSRVSYAMDWANRMPPPFPVYPGGNVTEAAGADNAPCAIRAVSFTTSAPPEEVMDFYYTMARRAGYSAEHVERNGEHVLGGTRAGEDGAFYLSLTASRGGGTAADLIANGGR